MNRGAIGLSGPRTAAKPCPRCERSEILNRPEAEETSSSGVAGDRPVGLEPQAEVWPPRLVSKRLVLRTVCEDDRAWQLMNSVVRRHLAGPVTVERPRRP